MGANNKKTKKRKRELKEYLSLESLQTVKKTLLSWLKKVTEKASLLKKTVIFYFYISRLTVKTYFRFRILHFLNAKRMLIGSVVYFSLLLGSIFLFGQFIDPVFARSDAITFFTAVAAMIGGILAIIFSLSILLMGNAAERIPVGFYETAARDWLHDVIFFLIRS